MFQDKAQYQRQREMLYNGKCVSITERYIMTSISIAKIGRLEKIAPNVLNTRLKKISKKWTKYCI